jgi:Domain of unknown function (DUF4413)
MDILLSGYITKWIYLHATFPLSLSISMPTLFETSEDGALFNVPPAYNHILSKLEDAKKRHTDNSRLGTCINLAWKKLDKYYNETDVSDVYFVAAVLDPRVKLHYFEQDWEWLTSVREKIRALYGAVCPRYADRSRNE